MLISKRAINDQTKETSDMPNKPKRWNRNDQTKEIKRINPR